MLLLATTNNQKMYIEKWQVIQEKSNLFAEKIYLFDYERCNYYPKQINCRKTRFLIMSFKIVLLKKMCKISFFCVKVSLYKLRFYYKAI